MSDTHSAPPFDAGCGYLSAEEVEAALDGRLSDERLAEFDRHIEDGCSDCVTLAADLRVFRRVVEEGVLETERREDDRQAELLRARLAREANKTRYSEPRSATAGGLGWRWASVAAAALIVAALGWLALRDGGVPGAIPIALPGGETYLAQVKTFSAPPVLRGERNLEELWRSAETAYNGEDYGEAERALAEILEQRPESFDARVYRAVCLLAVERVGEARAELAEARELAEEQDFSTTSLAWFESLAALADGDTAASRVALEEAAAGAGTYAENARDLLARLSPR